MLSKEYDKVFPIVNKPISIQIDTHKNITINTVHIVYVGMIIDTASDYLLVDRQFSM